METTIKTLIFILLSGISHLSFGQCGPVSLEPDPLGVGYCEGGPADTIFFTTQGNCTGNWEFEVKDVANNIVQPWSTTDMFIINTPISDTFTVTTRCSTCPTTTILDTILVESIEEPTFQGNDFLCHGSIGDFVAFGPDSDQTTWWDAPTGGNQLSTDSNYVTPPLVESDTFYMNVAGSFATGGGQGSVLITEAGLEGFPGASSADYVEISNLYSTAVNTTGWVVAISDSYSNINSVNSILWNLPSSFQPCSMVSKTDVSYQPNYWGNNIFWASGQPGWVAIIDNNGQLVDFIAWGWSAAQIANFGPFINGNVVTIGNQWTGPGCNSNCSSLGGTPYSFSRNGNTDNNDTNDFVCQPTSLNVVNPGLNCNWLASDFECVYPAPILIDSLPSATAPDTTFLECYANIPAPDPAIITDAADDYTANPTVTYVGETSDGNMCPEILTRTYKVEDSCSNFIEVEHIIVIHDTVAPTMDPAPADLFVECPSQIPPIASLNWSDNCLGSGTLLGTETTSGTTCPEVLTRTWTVTDTCGNSVTRTQVITVNDTIAPVIDPAPADLSVQCPEDVPPMVSLSWTDNCLGSGVLQGVEVSDGQTCPETITRTWSIEDDCGNVSTETQVIVINDDIPPTASNLPGLQLPELPAPDISVITDAADNCGEPTVQWENDSTDFGFCPENVIRTYSVTDDCGNVTLVTRHFIIGDQIPDVSFTADPLILDDFSDGVVNFNNQTTGAVTHEWDFGDTSSNSFEISPSHEYDISKSTHYKVWLISTSEYDCVDSASVVIEVFQELLYFIPNAFTPDNDGYNQTFQPVFAAGFDPKDYQLIIYNRWGEVLFESNNDKVGWDGTYGGKLVQDGTYMYKIEFGLKHYEERKVVTGHFSLIR